MPITYEWQVVNLQHNTDDGKVIVAHYRVNAFEDTYEASAYGTVSLGGEITVPYDELTEEICITWVQDALAERLIPKEIDIDGKELPIATETLREMFIKKFEATLAAEIEKEKNPTTAEGTPWS